MAANSHSLDLERDSSQYASIADASQTGLDITGNFTIEAWVKLEQLPSTGGNIFFIAGKYYTTGNQRSYNLEILSTDKLNIAYSGDGISANGLLSAAAVFVAADVGKWVHVAAAVNVSGKSCTFYKNGISIGAGSLTDAGQTAVLNGTANFAIGARNSDGTADHFFDGLIDDVRVWSDIRTATEIHDYIFADVTGEGNLVGYWKLDNAYTDSSGNGNTLTSSGSPSFAADPAFPNYRTLNPVALGSTALASDADLISYWPLDGNSNDSVDSNNGTDTSVNYSATNAKFGQRAGLSGANSFIKVARNVNMEVSEFTVCGWFYNTQAVATSGGADVEIQEILGKPGANKGFEVQLVSDGFGSGIDNELVALTANGTGNNFVYSKLPIPINTYVFFALVHSNASGTNKLYINGILVGSAACSNISHGTTDEFYLGIWSDESTREFYGNEDDIAFFDRVLTAQEIFDLYTGVPLTSAIKTIKGLAKASVKTFNGLAIASVKSINGLT